MKKTLLSVLFLCIGLNAQENQSPTKIGPAHILQKGNSKSISVTGNNVPVASGEQCLGGETTVIANQTINSTHSNYNGPGGGQRSNGTVIGDSYYDTQGNSGMARRVEVGPDGNVYAIWTMSQLQQDSYTDRGTGFNQLVDGSWGPLPLVNIENNIVRSGFGSIGITENGRLFVFTHSAIGSTPQGLNFTYRNEGSSQWINVPLGLNVLGDPNGIWCRTAVSGNSIHVIISRQSAGTTATSAYDVIGGLKYFRSLDAGDTWEEITLNPGLSNYYTLISAENYFIDARDETVAFMVAKYAGQTVLYKSNDNGDTWDVTVVQSTSNPFIDSANASGTESLDPVAASTGLTLVLDSNHNAHAALIRVYNNRSGDETTAGVGYYPNSSCLMYWTEGMDAPEVIGKTVIPDTNQDGTTAEIFDEVNLQGYGSHRVGHPSIGIDADDNLYLAYSSEVDGQYAVQPIPGSTNGEGKIFRDIFIVKKNAGGNWEGPLNVSNSDDAEDVYPSIQRHVDGTVHLIYQSDPLAGTHGAEILTAGNGHSANPKVQILYVPISPDEIIDPANDINTEPEINVILDLIFSTVIQGCENSLEAFEGTHVLDYPDGDITDELVIGGVDINTVGVYEEGWVLTSTDSDGNVEEYQVIATDGSPFAVEVIEDVDDPVIVPFPFTIDIVDENGNFISYFGDSDTYDVYGAYNDPNLPNGTFLGFTADPNFLDMDVIQYSNYVDPGFDVLDQTTIVGCYPDKTTTGSVDTDVVGTYTLTYDAVDVSGKIAESVVRTINVIAVDEESPFFQVFGANGEIENGGTEVVTLDENSSFTPFDTYYFDNVDGYNVTVETSGNVDLTLEGSYDIEYTITDQSGNVTVHTVTVIVNQAPTISIPTTGLTVYMCQGDDVIPTHDFTATDSTDGDITANVTNNNTQVVNVSLPGNYIVTYTITDSVGETDSATGVVSVVALGTSNNNISCITGINEVNELNSFVNLYPSPATDQLNIDLSQISTENLSIVITDLKGATVANYNNIKSAELLVDLTNWSSGIYMLHLTNNNGTAVKKFVKE